MGLTLIYGNYCKRGLIPDLTPETNRIATNIADRVNYFVATPLMTAIPAEFLTNGGERRP